jgi:plastocyanin
VLGGACDDEGPGLCTPDACLNEEAPNHDFCVGVGFCATLCDELVCFAEGHPAHDMCVELGECEDNNFEERLSATTTSQVTVVFDGKPDLVAPEDVTVEAVSPNGTPVALGDPEASICIPGGVEVSHDGPARYRLGSTTVVWTAQGVQGRASTDSQVVTVVDTSPPSIEVGPDRVFDTGGDVALPTPVVSDNGTPVAMIAVSHDAPQSWPQQAWTTVTWTATDLAGNSATDSMRVYVRERGYPAPTLTITAPEDGVWVPSPAHVRARFTDSTCTQAPAVVSNEEGLSLTVTRDGEGWDVVAVFSSDGVHNLTLTGTSGCSGKAAHDSRLFGVDSSAPVPHWVTSIPQDEVDPAVPLSWRPISRLRELPLGMVLDDRVSGLASVRVELLDHAQGTTTLLHEEVLSQRQPGSSPVRGLPVRPISGCSDELLCQDGSLQLRLLTGRYYAIRVTSEDVAGNRQSFSRYLQALNLYQAVDLWDREVRATETESEVARELLNRISSTKLQPALRSYEHGYYGNIWLAVEDSISLLRVARLEDEGIDHDFFLELVGELGVDFMRFKVEESIQDRGVTTYTNLSHEQADLANDQWTLREWQDVFTSLGNAWFWLTFGQNQFAVEGYTLNAVSGYQSADEVMDQIYAQMRAYVDTSEELPGRPGVQEVLALLDPVREYLLAVVDEGDLAQSDYAHMDAIMTLGQVAQRLDSAEDSIVWVRNWRLGLTNIVALYAERALFSAASWITRSNPVFQAGQERYEEAEVYRVEHKPDSYMATLIDSRCDIIGVYNAIYEPNYEVPLECCARVREFYALDSQFRGEPSEIPIPEACLETLTVEITATGFVPATVELSVGQRVKFINKTGQAQRIVAGAPGSPDPGTFDTGELEPNAVYEARFGASAQFGFFSSAEPSVINGGQMSVTQ